MIVALLVMLVTSLLVTAAFVGANGDIKLTRTDTSQTKAYYAALAGISEYKYQLKSNPNYWLKCPTTGEVKVTGTADETYTVKTLHSSKHTESECKAGKQSAILETSGSAIGTFRIESTGTSGSGSGKETRSIVATFTHPGFLDYVYFTNYEILDPAAQNPEPTECEHYYEYRVEHNLTKTCGTIQFAAKDKVNGPMHTNDAGAICAEGGSEPTFGRTSSDKIEMDGGHYGAGGSCSNSPNILGTFTEEGPTLTPPETDSELLEAAGYKFKGKTIIELHSGTPNTMTVKTGGSTETKTFPENGVVYVENAASGCNIKYAPFDTSYTGDENCGNVYVKGSYTESLTIAAANDVIISGSIETTHESSGEPTGGAALGLIATNFVRIYHPVQEEYSVEHYTPKTEQPVGASKEICATTTTRSGKLTSGNKEVTSVSSSTAGLTVGEEISGTGIATGTTIKEIKSSTVIILSKNATASGTQTLTFYKPTGFEYHSGQKLCVEEGKSGYTYHESETLYAEECNSTKDTYTSNGKCEYQNNSSGCDAENLSKTEDPNGWGSIEPTIDAAILSTAHSFIVDNFKCGKHLGELTVWGSIAQFWRGPVGTGGSSTGTGYTKNYNYDDRLTGIQPPDFLSPSTTSWKLSRETAPPNNFTG
jgi:hypothetical protein